MARVLVQVDPGIDDDALDRNSAGERALHFLAKEIRNLRHDIIVVWMRMSGARSWETMRDDEARVTVSDDPRHGFISQAARVIDHVGTGADALARDLRSEGIDRNDGFRVVVQRFDDGNHSVDFLLDAHRLPRCEGHSADIDPIGPLRDRRVCGPDRLSYSTRRVPFILG
jgi:hypothetical protein